MCHDSAVCERIKMKKEFDLSEWVFTRKNNGSSWIPTKKVNEFINIVLEEPVETAEELKDIIRDRAGDDLK